ncbi:MAG TPA: type VI secretion system membrane subunit TssM [Blastocatellia bacterium]|nr:type VI secretion system membrane subunit TssM [Blastocatellia bacterium]
MSSHKDQLKYALNIAMYVSLYSIACLFIFFLGSWTGLALPYQVALVALILLTWPFAIAVDSYRKRRERRRVGDAPEPRAGDRPGSPSPARAYAELTRGAEEAVQWLRGTRLGAAKSGDPIYTLPWFLIAGPSKSGKTSMLLSSGLDFQALPSQRRADLNVIRPTRDCVWRVTDSAVNVDTAGRYQIEGPDGAEWSALIETLKKHRRNRPLDGLVIAVDASRLLACSDTEAEQQAKILRARLDDSMQRAQARFPVYLVFTHLDSIEGFEPFFEPFDAAERSQVWGATIPLEQARNAHALFDVEFDYLYDALMRRRLVRLAAPAPAAKQLRVFNFPLSFGQARRKLGLFASVLFRPSPFSENPLLRGFYFTSSASGASSDASSEARPRSAAAKAGVITMPLVNPTATAEQKAEEVKVAGQSYFTERLFKDVLLRDKDLAQSFLLNRKKPLPVRLILAGAAGAILLLLGAGVITSYFGNRKLVEEARARGLRLQEINRIDTGKEPAGKTSVEAAVELSAVEELREVLAELDEYEKDSPPIYLRFGLYSGDEINRYLRVIYFDAIDRRFYKPVVAALERDLRAFTSGSGAGSGAPAPGSAVAAQTKLTGSGESAADLGRYYDLLKTYLMLSNVEKAEPSFLQNQLADYWRSASPGPDLELLGEEQLKFFAGQANRDDTSHYKPDDKLVADARRKLQSYPAADRLFKQIISGIDAEVQPVTLEGVVRDRGRGVLAGSYAVPGSFTIDGYRDHWLKAVESAGEEISKDDWVMGPEATATGSQGGDIGRLQSVYFREYTTQWQKFLKGVNVRPFKTKADAVDTLKALSASDSALELLMVEVKRNTDLSAAPESGGIWGWIRGLFSSDSKGQAGASEVEKEFRPLFSFVSAEDKTSRAPVSEYRAALDQLLRSLEARSDDQLAQAAKSLLTGKDEVGLQKAEQEISRALDPFKTAASRDAARLLAQPLDNLRAMLYGGGYEQIDKAWREQLYPKARALESAFPFTDSSSEAPVADMARFLNPAGGQLAAFFNERLASSFEDAQGKWKLKEAGAVKLSEGFVNYLNSARELQEALFASGGAQPEVGYELKLQPVTGTDVRIEVDGNSVETRGASVQAARFTWPARSGASGARIIVLKNGQQAEASFPGEWGLFRMFAAGNPSGPADNQFQLSWSVGSVTVRATLQPSSAASPFERRMFTQMRAPQGPNE